MGGDFSSGKEKARGPYGQVGYAEGFDKSSAFDAVQAEKDPFIWRSGVVNIASHNKAGPILLYNVLH